MYEVNVSNDGGYAFTVNARAYSFVVDMYGEKGVTPPDALLASLASCVGVYIRKYADSSKLDIPSFSVRAQGELSKEAPVCFREVTVTLDIKGAALDERRKKAILDFIRNCPVHNTLKANPRVEVSFT